MKVTENAIAQFKNAIEQYNTLGCGVRLFTSSGCCSPALQMDIVNQVSVGDKILSINEVDFFVEPQADEMLSEVTIDFRENSFKLDGLKKSGGCCS
ncbi:MAG: hypothetical protein HXX14_10245 [Bacteroidetes bacterium]|nr:hypothetical protein [Bacteroidota bacterium]